MAWATGSLFAAGSEYSGGVEQDDGRVIKRALERRWHELARSELIPIAGDRPDLGRCVAKVTESLV